MMRPRQGTEALSRNRGASGELADGGDNVKLVQSFFSAEQWDEAFPLADSIYTYDNFLKAIAKFPYFCGESNISDLDIG